MHMDLRKTDGLLDQVKDPKVGTVSQLLYDERTGCLLVAGSDDFSLWRPHQGRTVPAGHGLAGTGRRVSAQASGIGATLVDGGRFLVTTGAGHLGAYQLTVDSPPREEARIGSPEPPDIPDGPS